jgi:hypothetical protein
MASLRWLFLLAVLGGTASAAVAQPVSATDTRLLADADRIAAEVAKIRGLSIKKPIRRGVIAKQELLQRMKTRVQKDYTPEQIRGEGLALKRFGLIPEAADYLTLVLNLLTDEIVGFYDPFEKQLFLSGGHSEGGEFVMSHEICHALQDQHFDLKAFLEKVKTDNDQLLARQALVEGDGLALSLEYTMARLGQQVPWGQEGFAQKMTQAMVNSMTKRPEVPLVLRESLIFPYGAGTAFVGYFRKHHPWRKIDQLFAKPPLSTEHILHADKYRQYEKPHVITSKPLKALSGYTLAHDNNFGEMMTALFLRQHGVRTHEATMAAAGWGGDRLLIYTPPGYTEGLTGVIGILFWSWDADADAIEHMAALEKIAPALAATARRKGTSVVLIVGAPPERTNELADESLRTFLVRIPAK